ncbi:phenylacetyl-CoA ligase [Ramaria rubella]|nr:phenylacetyl-CoA ligase [Ramaria rubella]
MIFQGGPLLPPPDDLTIPQFILDNHHPLRPVRKSGSAWLVDEPTGKSYGFEEIRTRVQGLASSLRTKHDIQDDDVVCLFSQNHIGLCNLSRIPTHVLTWCPDYPIVLWATLRLGAIITHDSPSYTELLTTTRAKLIITNPASEAVALEAARTAGITHDRIILLSGVAPNSSSDLSLLDDLITVGLQRPPSFTERRLKPGEGKTKLAFLSFSSGTTGKPKAVAIPHYSVISNILQMATFHRVADTTYDVPRNMKRFRVDDVAGGVLPLFHIYGLVVNLHYIVFNGMTLVLTPKFNYEEMLQSIVRYKITHLMLVPPQVVLFCKHPATKKYDLSSVRWVMVGAAPLSPEVTLQFQQVLPQAEIGQGYGMTETCTTVSMTPLSQRLGTPGCAGHLLPGVRAKVVKPDGTLGGYNETGELVVAGPQMSIGYPNNPQATKETYIDGWVHTGDSVLMKEDGDMFIVDRLKEIFKVRGFQVAPAELEGHLLDHPDVGDAGVIGVPDDFSGEVPMAFIALNADALLRLAKDPAEGERIKKAIIKHVADAKVQYKWLAGGVEFIDAIPKNPSGKLLRRFLRVKASKLIALRKPAKARL